TAVAASTPKAVLRSNAPAIQPTASTASQPTNSAATPARPKVMTRSRRRGASGATTATGAGSLGVTGSVRSGGRMRGAHGPRAAPTAGAGRGPPPRRPRSRAPSAQPHGRLDRSLQPVSEQKFERQVEVDVGDPFDRRGIEGGRFEHRHVEEGRAPGVGARRTD